MAFIDAELARRYRPPSPGHTGSAVPALDNSPLADPSVHRQPAALGRIMEIDLGPDVRARNIAAIERARAVRDGMAGSEQPELPVGKKRHRRRRRRNSEDLRRDRLVEQVLKENRRMDPILPVCLCSPPVVEVYDEPAAASAGPSDDEDAEAADERVAEQFRREFLDAQQAKRKRQPPAPTTAKGKDAAKESKSKGPKLGGSRSARAAMREKELAEKGVR